MKNKFKKIRRKFVKYQKTNDILPIDLKSIDEIIKMIKLE